jgi:aspartate racemase
MTKHIGIVACSAEGAALCYRTICAEAAAIMGEHAHPEISLHNHSLALYLAHIRAGAWQEVAGLMLSSVEKLAQAGADFAICPDNTIHQAFDLVAPYSPIPWLHIARCVAEAAVVEGFSRLGITGTKSLMSSSIYPEALDEFGIAYHFPSAADQDEMDRIIHQQLVYGRFPEASRLYFNEVIQKLKNDGCDAVVLGCTEIPLLVDPGDCPLLTLDSTRLLARAALRFACRPDHERI